MIRITGDLIMEGRVLLPDLALDCPPGRWTALMGPSGVGKSTLGRIVAGLPVAARLAGAVDVGGPVTLMGQQVLQGSVTGTAVHDDPVEVPVGLAGYAQMCPLKPVTIVQADGDDGEQSRTRRCG